MDNLNSTISNKHELTKISFSNYRNLTLDQFKSRLLNCHNKTRNPISTKLPLIQTTKNRKQLKSTNKSRASEVGLSTISFTSTKSSNILTTEYPKSTNYYPLKINLDNVEYDQLKDKDINPLISYYHFTETSSSKNNFKKFQFFSNTDKSELFTKYKLRNCNDSKLLLSSTNTDENNNVMASYNKSRFIIHGEFFKNPKSSLDNLDLNKRIYENVMNITIQKQKQKYIENYNKVKEKERKINNMPQIRTSAAEVDKIKEKQHFINEKMDKQKANNFLLHKSYSRDQILIPGLELKVQEIVHSKNKPKSRAHASITFFDGKLYLFGGVNNSALNDFWVNDLNGNLSFILDEYQWTMITSKEEPLPRYGHSSVVFKKEIYIYGGIVTDITYMGREDLIIYDTEKKKLKLEEKTFNKMNLKWRRNHTADMVGNHMVVFGGIDDTGMIIDDLCALDLNFTLKWNIIETKGQKQKPLAYHCTSLILSSEKKNHPLLNLFKFPEMPSGRTTIKGCKFEGIAFFGGIDNERNINNEFRILKIGKKPLEWVTPVVSGSVPTGRLNATMNYYETLNVIILFGGQNNFQNSTNDLYILNLDSFFWIKIKLYHDIPSERSAHSSCIFKNQLIIFGGINSDMYVGSDIFTVNLDIFDKKNKTLNTFLKPLPTQNFRKKNEK